MSAIGETIVRTLEQRHDVPTRVQLADGQVLLVYNIVAVRGSGGAYDRVTTNINPAMDQASPDFFSVDEVVALVDPATGRELFTHSR